MRRGLATWIGACLLAAALAAALASCGGDSSEATAKGGSEASRAEPGRSAALPRETRAKLSAASARGRCAGQLGGLLEAMDGLRAARVSGLAYEQYVGEVKGIKAVYDQLPVDELALGCLRAAGTAAEKALNRYIAAGNEWTDCVEVPSCEAASIEAPLQAKWKQASGYLSKAQRGLRQQGSG
ncbi:MAG: hypothetical protein ACOYD4_09055 [Solirubrobacterales bacterium]